MEKRTGQVRSSQVEMEHRTVNTSGDSANGGATHGFRRRARATSAWLAFAALFLFAGLAHAAQTVTYYYTDAQGTVLATADAAGNIIAPADYRPYGTQVLGMPDAGPGYAGHVNDPDSGLVNMQARYYDPARASFVSVDPVGPSPGNLFSFNRYDYTGNNPVNHVDPDGRCSDADFSCGKMVSAYGAHPWATPGQVDAAAGLLPVVGDVTNIINAYNDPSALNIAVAAVGIIPEGGSLVGKAVKEAKELSSVGKATSKIDRAAFKSERNAFWKTEAKANPGKYSEEDLAKMQKGGAPIGPDGHPMELHHVDGTPDGGVTPMSRTDHRGGENYKDNHPWLFNDKQ